MQDFSLHTHTIGFDGRNTPTQMVRAAVAKKFNAIGISNHFSVHPFMKNSNMYKAAHERGYDAIYSSSFAEALARFVPHFNELGQMRHRRIRVLRGLEADFFRYPAWRAGFERAVEQLNPDYVIGSAHFLERTNDLYNMHDLSRISYLCDLEPFIAQYWRNVKTMAETGLFNIIAHIDLPKKLGMGREYTWIASESDAIDAIARAGCILEINTSSFRDFCEPYPSRRILNMAIERNIPLILSDDAHRAEHIGRDFDAAENWARGCGAKNFVGIQKVLDFSHSGR